VFHAYTGCDTVFEEVTPTFLALSTGPAEVTDEDRAMLERFTIMIMIVQAV
jgi:hypothetical protein